MESLVFNHSKVKTNPQLAVEIDKEFQQISPYLSQMLDGTDILAAIIGSHIRELCIKVFSPEDVVSAESFDSLKEIAQKILAIKALYGKWQALFKSNEGTVIIHGKEFPESFAT